MVNENTSDFVYGRARCKGVVDEQNALSFEGRVDSRLKTEGKSAANIEGTFFPRDGRLTFSGFFPF